MGKPAILAISGSLRKDSATTAILRTLAVAAADRGVITVQALNDIPLYNGDRDGKRAPKAVRELKEAVAAADGIILASPEYNYGMSGVLKNAIDWASRPAFASPLKNKPVLIITSSPGSTGGVRAQLQVRETMAATLSRVVTRPEVIIAGVFQKIVDGVLVDEASLAFALAAVDDLLSEIAHLN